MMAIHRIGNRVPTVPGVSRSASVEQLVSQFEAVPSKHVNVRMDSIADQIRYCSIGYNFKESNNKERTEVHAVLRNPECDNLDKDLPTNVHKEWQNAFRLSRESHQAMTE